MPRDPSVAPVLAGGDRRDAWRWALAPLAISLALLAGAAIAHVPLERLDASTAVSDRIHLALPAAYLVLDPACRLLDALSLLTLAQHLGLCCTLLAIVVVRHLLLKRLRPRTVLPPLRRQAVGAALAVALVYAACILLPRPMAALAVDSPDVLKIDFHSHTSASHDGRTGFDLEHNRAWHSAAGFDVAYVSDHATWAAIGDGDRQGATPAGGTVLLSAVEAGLGRARVVALGPQSIYASALHGNQFDRAALASTSGAEPRTTDLVYTVVAPKQDLQSQQPPQIPGLVAIEISDASPRGLVQSRDYHATLSRWADQLNVALVASSDNHGWGRTAAAWTLMKVPGWQRMPAPELAGAIEGKLRLDGRHATTVVALRPPAGDLRGWQVISTVPVLAWNLLTSLAPSERLSWAGYVWGIALLRRRSWRKRADEDAHARPLTAQ